MRYLTRQFAIGALRRGKRIEQFLGGSEVDGEPAVRWVAISPIKRHYRVSVHTVQDPDDDQVRDLPNLLSLDPVDEPYAGEGRELGVSDDETEAIVLAERLTNAAPDRWVNHSMAGDESVDYVLKSATPTRRWPDCAH